eukprot:TRINITY_DN13616_c0_g2_i2.p1 TRINITY_DN13616_c0_g2~~TRINITY_DN13616_c0_g2_i2.p1  ORF type:complete len:191 (+),score=11.98 TRINITY_DN13616_c0_g2_i2:3-575(+)
METTPSVPIKETDPEIEIQTSWASLLSPHHVPLFVPLDQAAQLGATSTRDRALAYDAFFLRFLFSEEECRKLILAAEGHGFGRTDYPKLYRGNLRLTTTDVTLSEAVWKRIAPFVPGTITMRGREWKAVGLNECWRLAKYHPGDCFKRHLDSFFQRSGKEMSFYTVNIYMNSGYLVINYYYIGKVNILRC